MKGFNKALGETFVHGASNLGRSLGTYPLHTHAIYTPIHPDNPPDVYSFDTYDEHILAILSYPEQAPTPVPILNFVPTLTLTAT